MSNLFSNINLSFSVLFYTFAGFLIYPDTPVKMETTSRKAFCFRPVPQPTGGEVHNLISPKSKPVYLNYAVDECFCTKQRPVPAVLS